MPHESSPSEPSGQNGAGTDRVLTDPVNWAAMSHRDLFVAVHRDNDPAQGHALSREWNALAREMDEASATLETTVRGTESGWRGEAAESARASILRLASRGRELAATTEEIGGCLGQQSTVVERAKAAMPEPAGFDAEEYAKRNFGPGGGLGEFVASAEPVKQHSDQASSKHQQAVDVMTTMETESRKIDEDVPSFTQEQATASALSEGTPGAESVSSTGAKPGGQEALSAATPPQATPGGPGGAPTALEQPTPEQPTPERPTPEQPTPGGTPSPLAAEHGGSAAIPPASPATPGDAMNPGSGSGSPSDLQPAGTDAAAAAPPVSGPPSTLAGGGAPVAGTQMGGDQQHWSSIGATAQDGNRNKGWQGAIPASGRKPAGESSRLKNRSLAANDAESFAGPDSGPRQAEQQQSGPQSHGPGTGAGAGTSGGTGFGVSGGSGVGGSGTGGAGTGTQVPGVPPVGGGAPSVGSLGGGSTGGGSPIAPGGSASAAPTPGPPAPPPAGQHGSGDTGATSGPGGGAVGGMPMGAGAGAAKGGGGGDTERESPGYLQDDQSLFEHPERGAPAVIGEKLKKKQS